MKKLSVVNNHNEEYFIMEEKDNEVPVFISRANSIEDLLKILTEQTGVEINYDPYFGDYIAKSLTEKKNYDK